MGRVNNDLALRRLTWVIPTILPMRRMKIRLMATDVGVTHSLGFDRPQFFFADRLTQFSLSKFTSPDGSS